MIDLTPLKSCERHVHTGGCLCARDLFDLGLDSPLAAEVDWVAEHAGLSVADLATRLGDPRRFRLSPARS